MSRPIRHHAGAVPVAVPPGPRLLRPAEADIPTAPMPMIGRRQTIEETRRTAALRTAVVTVLGLIGGFMVAGGLLVVLMALFPALLLVTL